MDIRGDFSDVNAFFDEGRREVEGVMSAVGDEAVAYAVAHGSYQNRTGNLRASNRKNVTPSGLELTNEAFYASFVESKGFDVLTAATLEAEKLLRERIA
ncbi:MAG: hypothetical protein LBB27_01075 [Tannerellaceae bacterium]|jgi:hypothetical protein|nr:hypothetical protein [Tannerellaceae bacterium]